MDVTGRVTTTFFISNLHCPSCVTSIEASLATLQPQPISVSHSIISHSITVSHHAELSTAIITEALEQAGFEVYSVVHGQSAVSSGWQQASPMSRSGDWGLEQAVQRWTQSRKGAHSDLDDNKKRKRHMDQCKQCQEEALAPSRQSSQSFIEKDAVVVKHENTGEVSGNDKIRKSAGPVVVVDDQAPRIYRVSFAISGMTCSACVGNVSKAITPLSCVIDPSEVNVNLLSNSATVTFQGYGNEAKIIESVEDAGYDISLEGLEEVQKPPKNKSSMDRSDMWKASYSIGGMTCSACVGAITNALQEHTWIENVDVNLISNSATVTYHGKDRAAKIKEMIEDIGYDASLEDSCDLGAATIMPSERKVTIRVSGMYCHHCPERIIQALSETYGDRIVIEQPLSEAKPLLRIAYKPQAPGFTLRHIVNTIKNVDTEIDTSIFHPPTIEERSHEIHATERRRILLRLALSVIVAIPTFIIGIVYMSLVKSTNPGRRYLMESMWAGTVSRGEWALFIMSTVIYFFAADIFHIRTLGGIRALWRRSSPVPVFERFYRFGSMNMLITIGTSIAYFSSIAALAINASQKPSSTEDGTSYYFDSVVFLTMFLLLGRFLEAYSKARTGDAVSSLGLLRPSEAWLVPETMAGTDESSAESLPAEQKVSVDLVEVGDIVRVPHGSSPPFDGTVVQGETKFDESSLTGESRLVSKGVGEAVYSGTINKGNPITIRLTSISGTSMLDQIIKVVREGQTRRAPVERVADVITSHFVPFIVLVGIFTWIIWLALGLSGALPADYLDSSTGGWPFWSLQFSIAVFVIACPCGIGLAGPTALFVGGGIAAKNGILVKGGGEAFQEASMLDCIVFDKTGTLTDGGQPAVTKHKIVGSRDARTVMSIAKALEENSGHPIASSIVGFCSTRETKTLQSYDVEEIAGRGIKGHVTLDDEEKVNAIIGNERLMEDYSVEVDAATLDAINGWKLKGMSIALLATSTASSAFALSAAFAISDPIRPEAAEVVHELQRRGLSVWLLSGDNQITAATVGKAVGILPSNVIAGVLPEQKADKIKYLQRTLAAGKSSKGGLSQGTNKSRATVAMVGDGINDAPALATADVGIAIGSGSDVALSTASFVLVTSELHALVTLITLSRAVFRRVWFNFGWALVYNMVALPIAAGVLYPIKSGGSHVRLDPVWASLAMALSSVSVVTSSLALRSKIPGIGFRPSKSS